MLKKGAMFGLDARIALAIFGALSVISGAALYSAIQTAKAEQWRQYFEEIIKGSEQYYLDNFKQLPMFTSYLRLYTSDLAENRENLSTWNGPYWPYAKSSGDTTWLRDRMTKTIITSSSSVRMVLRVSSTWTQMDNVNSDGLCVLNDSNCSEWIVLEGGIGGSSTMSQLFSNLDDLVDGKDGALAGTVRYSSSSNGYILYQGIPHKRTS